MKNATLRIAGHEIRQILREPKFLLPFLFPPVLLVVSQVALLPPDVPSWMVSRMMLFCALLIAPMIVPLASDSFAGERERGSLELLLLLPVRPSAVFYGKLLALLPVPLVLVALAETAYAAASGMFSFSVWWKSVFAGFFACVFFCGHFPLRFAFRENGPGREPDFARFRFRFFARVLCVFGFLSGKWPCAPFVFPFRRDSLFLRVRNFLPEVPKSLNRAFPNFSIPRKKLNFPSKTSTGVYP